MQAPGLEAALRDREGELAKRLGNVQIRDLRRSYGNKFAPRINRYARLRDVLQKLDTPSLLMLADQPGALATDR